MTKLIKQTVRNHNAIGRKIDPKRYAFVLIMRKQIPIGLMINLGKNQAGQTVHTPNNNYHSLSSFILVIRKIKINAK